MKRDKKKAIEEALEDSNFPMEPAVLTIVTAGKKLYRIEIEHDFDAENFREIFPDEYFSTIYILPDVRKAVEFNIGDQELSEKDLETLVDHKDDPDWLIIPLQVEIAHSSAFNPRIYAFSYNFNWWEDDKLIKGIDGFIVTDKNRCNYWNADQTKDDIAPMLQSEIREYNKWLQGEIVTMSKLSWEPISVDPMLDDVEKRENFISEGNMITGILDDDYDRIEDIITDWVTDDWHVFNPEVDKLYPIVQASFRERSIKCPMCGEDIAGFLHERTGWHGVCLRCDTHLNIPYHSFIQYCEKKK